MLSFQCTCKCSTLLPKLCTKETCDLYHVLYISLLDILKMHCHIVRFNLSIPGFHVSGFKLEDTDKRTVSEYLTTLNTREVLPASSTASYGITLCSIQILSHECERFFPFFIFCNSRITFNFCYQELKVFLGIPICFPDYERFA